MTDQPDPVAEWEKLTAAPFNPRAQVLREMGDRLRDALVSERTAYQVALADLRAILMAPTLPDLASAVERVRVLLAVSGGPAPAQRMHRDERGECPECGEDWPCEAVSWEDYAVALRDALVSEREAHQHTRDMNGVDCEERDEIALLFKAEKEAHAVTRQALARITDAWTVEGPRPDLHRAAKEHLLRYWPTLYNAVRAALGVLPEEPRPADDAR